MRANTGKTKEKGNGFLAIKWITLVLAKQCTANGWLSVQGRAQNAVPRTTAFSFSSDRTPDALDKTEH